MLPLHLAAEHGASVAVVGRLLQHHSHAATAKDNTGRLPLHLALGAEGEIKASCEAIGMILAAHPQVRTAQSHRGPPVDPLVTVVAPGVSNEGGSSPLLVLLPAVSWPWVPAWGSLEPPR